MKRRTLAAWAARTAAADRLSRGSTLLLRRGEHRLAAWVRAGRREDLTGWQASLGCWLRLAALGAAALTLYAVLRAARGLMWLLAACWITAAWRAGKDPAETGETPAGEPDDQAAAEDGFRQLVQDAIGDRKGVHLATLVEVLHAHEMHLDWDVPEVHSVCRRLSIPVRRCLKLSGKVAMGIHRDDLTAPAEPPSETPSPAPAAPAPAAPSTPASTCASTPGLPPDLPASTGPSTPLSPHFESGVKTL